MIDKLLKLLPYWHYEIEKPLKLVQKDKKISFETYYCLKLLSDEKEISMGELAGKLRMSKQQITKIINQLYQYDFVKRINHPTDRRVIHIKITKKALYYMEHELNLNEQFLNLLQENFDVEELKSLEECLDRLITILVKEK